MKTRYFYTTLGYKMYVHSAKAVLDGWDIQIRGGEPQSDKIEEDFHSSALSNRFDKDIAPVRYIVCFHLTTSDTPYYIWDAGAATVYRRDAKSYPTRFTAGIASSSLHEKYPENLAYIEILEK